MKYDIILCGVGGQGVLSVAAAIATAAGIEGFNVRQSEVHGMAQRGGAVLSHLRISDKEIFSDMVPSGSADMILSMEPLEALRYVSFLKPDGVLITSNEPFVNITDYPELHVINEKTSVVKNSYSVNTTVIAKESGNAKAGNMVMVGAASKHLPLKLTSLKSAVQILFKNKGEDMIKKNIQAMVSGGEV